MTFPTKAQLLQEKLNQNKRSQKLLMFPSNLETEGTANIIRFNINIPSGSKYLANGDYKKAVDTDGNVQTSTYRQERSGASLANRFSGNYVRTTTSIDLYMPPQVQTSYQSDWGQEELGSLGSAADAGKGLANIDSWDDASKAWEVVKRTLKESGIRTAASALQSITPLNFETLRKTATSSIANPYTEVLFNGVQNRTFSFTFKMIPQNQKEQESVKAIVDEFKFHRAPEFQFGGQSNYLLFPSEFDIQFLTRSGENPWLFKISTCALTSFDVNYSPEGNYASHEDGSPFATEITLAFTELETLTKDSHKKGY
jgi:hypothetical protein